MNKEDLKNYIISKRAQISSVIEYADESNITISPVFDKMLKWFSLIMEDLEIDGLIPEKYFEIILHNIDALQLTSLPSSESLPQYEIKHFHLVLDTYIKSCTFESIEELYHILKILKFTSVNTVIVGANGCGKTSLATMLQKSLNKLDGIVIPAQKLLIVPTFDSIPNYNKTIGEYNSFQRTYFDDKRTFDVALSSDIPYELMREYGSEYKRVLSALLSERLAVRNKYCDKKQQNIKVDESELTSKLDIVINLWNSLIGHRTLICDENNNLVLRTQIEGNKTGTDQEYPAWQTSDGERMILYLIGRVLLAPQNALIFVDEPEMYLHKTIVDKLWDKLELERKDCVFIYMTHDLHFATSRLANKLWIKSFTYPNQWEINKIEDNEIPEELLLTLLGSRKRILFCEGKNDSMDKQIFEVLFPKYTIFPVESCKNVINYTKAFNDIPNANTKAYGIIDRDFRVEAQITKLKEENIFTYDVAEIENTFLIEDFIKGFAEYKHEEYNIDEIKKKILEKLHNEIEKQASNYVSSRINYVFSESHIQYGNTKEQVQKNFQKFEQEINIDSWYNDRISLINTIYENANYDKAIKIYNNKGLCTIIENELKIKDYWNKAISYLKATHEIEPLLKVFPDELKTN